MTSRSIKLPKSAAEFEVLAAQLLLKSPLRHLVSSEYLLSPGCRCWRSRRGMTVRLVYRMREVSASGVTTVTMILKGVPVPNG